jgi:hypothetical protein
MQRRNRRPNIYQDIAVSTIDWIDKRHITCVLTTACTKNVAALVPAPLELLNCLSKALLAAFHAQIRAGARPIKRHNATMCGRGSGNGTNAYDSNMLRTLDGINDFLTKDAILLVNR